MVHEAVNNRAAWLPCTQMKTAPLPLMAESTDGSRIRLSDGRELIDGLASWWTACHGYNHPHIILSMVEQLKEMPHIMFGPFVHEPALRLAERLAELAPGDLNHVFFSDSGSVAVEVALKMAAQYWLNRGERTRTKFIGFKHGYHGDTMGCMAVGDSGDEMYAHLKGWLPEHYIADLPKDDTTSAALAELMRHERTHIAGVIVEPLVQGVGGMRFHEPSTLRRLADLCSEHGLLLIADEICTGFGRTGTMFACEQAKVVPDIMCVGKALTGGAITLGATIARKHVFDAFLSDNPKHAFTHWPTYMANPLACAAANASLNLFETEPRLGQVKAMERTLTDGLGLCRHLPGVVDVRVRGAIGVVQFASPPDAEQVKWELLRHNVWVRSFGNVIYLTPALNIPSADLAVLIRAVVDVVGLVGTEVSKAKKAGNF